MTKRINTTGLNAIISTAPWQARQDAEQKSQRNAAGFTATQKSLAETTGELIQQAYEYKALYTNFRQKFISLKVAQPRPRNRDAVLSLDRLFSDRGYAKVLTPQGIIFRIPR
jgi:hypothetical protein